MAKPFADYDSRHYPTVDVPTGYGEWAPFYDQTVGAQLDLPLLEQVHSVPWPRVQTALDLGCGTGRIGSWLRHQGVHTIHGIDRSSEMLAQAASKQVYEQLWLGEMTACPVASCSYDLVITGLAACHLPDLGPLYREVVRVLRRGQRFILLDYHPFFLLRGIPTHFAYGNKGPLAIENVVHLFSDHVAEGRRADGLLLELSERITDAAWIAECPGMKAHEHQPASFVMVWQFGS